MMEPEVLKRDYVCSVCWSNLTQFTMNGETWIGCSKYRDEHKDQAFVRRSGIERARARSKEELMEVKDGLRMFDWYKKDDLGSTEDIIKSLGF